MSMSNSFLVVSQAALVKFKSKSHQEKGISLLSERKPITYLGRGIFAINKGDCTRLDAKNIKYLHVKKKPKF